MATTITTTKEVEDLIRAANGHFFGVWFQKKDGTLRKMVCRKGVKAFLTGGGRRYDPKDYHLLSVWSVFDREYRTIPLERIIRVKVAHREVFAGLRTEEN